MIIGIETCLRVPLQSVQLFLLKIVARLGYSTVKTNLYTVEPCLWRGDAAVVDVVLGPDAWQIAVCRSEFLLSYAATDVETKLRATCFAL